ncbi:Uncharacterised protein [Citrobacter braakii]|jgi:uncharacterized protein YodC (DUF2158 family)|uniref:hypothetical protein n=1 Tax=Enterobacterales TaxID=91347 RepID=UPI00079AFFE7|nr:MULTISPECIES: hypothetical protein [Enterobacterales]ATV42580.1 hypothetical protein CTV95_03550 [Pectobacterium brasiliense]ELE9730832.1 hypothetical protein [Enterobacter kobei]CZY11887.1 Uncharacterised protein [Enterobacter hormaechei]STH96600.1 Uncharacterised protein [Citrobacter braakii]
MAKFKPGDKVIHASGNGPEMVVEEAFTDMEGIERCDCSYWSDKETKFVTVRFPETALEEA